VEAFEFLWKQKHVNEQSWKRTLNHMTFKELEAEEIKIEKTYM